MGGTGAGAGVWGLGGAPPINSWPLTAAYEEPQVSSWMTLPDASVTIRVTDVLKPLVKNSARAVVPAGRLLVYSGGFSTALTMSAIPPPLQVTVRLVGQLHSWMVMVLLEPLVAQARMTIG